MDGGRLYSGSPQSPDQRGSFCHPQSSELGAEQVKTTVLGASVSPPTPDLSVSETAAVGCGLLALLFPVSDSFWIVTHGLSLSGPPPGRALG